MNYQGEDVSWENRGEWVHGGDRTLFEHYTPVKVFRGTGGKDQMGKIGLYLNPHTPDEMKWTYKIGFDKQYCREG